MIGVSVVKNEADIIEANIRHNLGFLDRIVVFDHDSCDATRRILDALAAEGLPITLLARRADRAEFGFWQGEFMTALAKLAFEQHGADYVFPIDADEFIDAASREAIETALDACPNEVANLSNRRRLIVPQMVETGSSRCLAPGGASLARLGAGGTRIRHFLVADVASGRRPA